MYDKGTATLRPTLSKGNNMIQQDMTGLYHTLHHCSDGYKDHNQGLLCIERWEPMLPDSRSILDIGCGNGLLLNELIKRGYLVSGCDVANGPYVRTYPFWKCDIRDTAIPAGYDLALCFDVLEHIDTDQVIPALANIAQSAERFVFTIAGYGEPPTHLTIKSPGWWLNKLVQVFPGHAWHVQVFERDRTDRGEVRPVYLFIGGPSNE